jgi:hypothetical protein
MRQRGFKFHLGAEIKMSIKNIIDGRFFNRPFGQGIFGGYFKKSTTPTPPVTNKFLLLDGSDFLLLDGTNFLLL